MASRLKYYVVALILIVVGRLYLNASKSTYPEKDNIFERRSHIARNDNNKKTPSPSKQNHLHDKKFSSLSLEKNKNSNLVSSKNFSDNTSEQQNASSHQRKEEYKNSVSHWMLSIEESFQYVESENTTVLPTEDGSLVYQGSNRDRFQIHSQVNSDGRIYADEVKTPTGQSFVRIYDDSGRVKTYFYQSNEANSIAINYNENGEIASVKQYINGKLFEQNLIE
jgi:antitoxin component YwqK of YwqJK toxin-antitoxin module